MGPLIKHPYFWIGVLAGWILFVVLSERRAEKEKYKQYPTIAAGIAATKKMLQSYQEGRLLPLAEVYPNCSNSANKGRKAWEGCAFWLVDVYATYSYRSVPIDAFFLMVEAYWGKDSAPLIKMQAFNEILNRSTKYYTNRGLPYHNIKDIDRTELYSMTQLIVDSFEDFVYEVK